MDFKEFRIPLGSFASPPVHLEFRTLSIYQESGVILRSRIVGVHDRFWVARTACTFTDLMYDLLAWCAIWVIASYGSAIYDNGTQFCSLAEWIWFLTTSKVHDYLQLFYVSVQNIWKVAKYFLQSMNLRLVMQWRVVKRFFHNGNVRKLNVTSPTSRPHWAS